MSAVPAFEPSGTNPYGSSGGGGAGGKFRKNSYRRPHAATPYDRPPSSIRSLPGFLSDLGRESGTRNDGWLRRIVNPAQRLITSGAHKMFASVFQKRLTQPPPPPDEKGQDTEKTQQEVVTTVTKPSREPEGPISVVQKVTSSIDDSSFVNLEKILKQRTFSKSEIDRLTALLHTRPLDSSVANEMKRPEVFSSGPHDLEDGTTSIMRKDDDNENQLPITHDKVLESDIASPAELAKAYMGNRASKVAPSGFREDYLSMTSSQQSPKLPVMSIIPASSNQRVHENGFITPRSRGRSAIYNMARTPYARVNQTTPVRILEPTPERGDGRSAATQTPETARIYGSNALKRRSSIFKNDFGSVGSLRRVRHKPNLLYPRDNSLLSSTSVATARRLTRLPSTYSSHKFADQSVGNEGIVVPPARNVPSVSSKSSEIASKILEQLDKIVSPPKEKSSVVRLASLRDKAPMKSFSSDLHGRALKSLDHVDSSKYLEIARGSSKLDDSHEDSGASALQQIDKVEQNGPSRAPFGFDELRPTGNHPEAATVEKHAVPNEKVVVLDEMIPLSTSSSSMNWTFRMNAHKDSVDLDDNGRHIKAASALVVDDRDKLELTTIKPTLTTEADAKDEPVPVSDAHVPPFGLKERKAGENPFTANSSEKTVTFVFPSIPPNKKNVETDVQPAPKPVSDSSTSKSESGVVPAVFTFGKEANSGNEERPAASALVFVNNVNGSMNKDADQFNGSPTTNFASQSSFSEISSSFFSTAAGPAIAIATSTELNKVDDKKVPIPGVLETPTPSPLAASATSSTTGFFKFGIPTGPTAVQPGFSLAAESSPLPARPVSNLPSVALGRSEGSDGKSTPQSASAFAHQTPIFNFGSTSTTSKSSEVPAVAPVEVQNKGDMGSVNTAGNPFSASCSANPSTVSSVFGFTSQASNGISSDQQGPVSFGVSNGPSQVFGSASSLGISSSTQSAPCQFGSSSPSFSFGSGNTITSSGSSSFGSSAAVKFSTGTSLGITSSPSSESTVVSSSSSTTSNLFGSLQTTAAPVFGISPSSTFPSTGFSFGALSSSGPISFGANAASSSSSIFGSFGASASSNGPSSLALSGSLTSFNVTPLFGSATSTSSPAPAFTFGASTAGSTSHPTFGNTNPAFSFGQTSTSNNDQINADDSMAEDTIPAATPPVSIFGQQQISPAPPSNFVFGSNPFQFGGQQNLTTPSNPPSFTASGSLDFNASGGSSFSLGTGGGDKSARKIVKVKHRQRRK